MRWNSTWWSGLVWCLFIGGVAAGCSQPVKDHPSKVVQVEGIVRYKGQPLPGAQLSFHREEAGESAFAVSDSKGHFTAMTNDTTGVFPGEYQVTATHPRVALPKKYADAESSLLHISVEPEEPIQNFELDLAD